MKRSLIYDLLKLKTNEGYTILDIGFKKKEGSSYGITTEGDMNFLNLIVDEKDFSEIITLNIQLSYIYRENILNDCKKHGIDEVQITRWDIIADEEGPCMGVYLRYGGELIPKENEELLEDAIKKLHSLREKLEQKLENLIDEYITEKEEKGYEKFDIIFTRNEKGEYRTSYLDFIRLVNDGRTISEQKHALREYLENGLEEKILNLLPSLDFDINEFNEKEFVVSLFTNGEEIIEPNVMVFDKTKNLD